MSITSSALEKEGWIIKTLSIPNGQVYKRVAYTKHLIEKGKQKEAFMFITSDPFRFSETAQVLTLLF